MTSGSSGPTPVCPAVASAGRLIPVREAHGHARFTCQLTFEAGLPDAVELVYLFNDAERRAVSYTHLTLPTTPYV